MAYRSKSIQLPAVAPGASYFLKLHEFIGTRTLKSAYIHAGIHADEHPGLLVMNHLGNLLNELDKQNKILGRIVLVPFANPIGMAQKIFGHVVGRFNLDNGENFNRNYPCIYDKVSKELTKIAFEWNDIAGFKEWFISLLDQEGTLDPVAANKLELLKEAFRHDIVLDLHCDTGSILHIYSATDQQERAERLASCVNVKTVFLEEEAGGKPFDESYAKPWKLLRRAGLVDEQHQGFSATIELRGQTDVSDAQALEDAYGIIRFLIAEGILSKDALPPSKLIKPETPVKIYPLEGVAHIIAPATGVLVFHKKLGELVSAQALIGEVIPIDGGIDAKRIPIFSQTSGIIVVQHHIKLVRVGQRIALVAGEQPLTNRVTGKLLHNF
ncbi:M14 family metallopeptidase [Leeia sp. TBRC 13508]|uniref:M14 family metallopeptidase n=1 Tax=Leeia speluncae TaxID=2884804 RepID=A0ABS8DA73_9NEIS|nr:succinylglutamate desuccinylase/aspartoacylase family protein [Leeia speluncae]MCB6185107.1 M14 family metallopeptidase [Leeia speluncae]